MLIRKGNIGRKNIPYICSLPILLFSTPPPISHPLHPSVTPSTHQSPPPPISHPLHPSVTPSTHQSPPPPISHPFHPSVTPSTHQSSPPPISHPPTSHTLSYSDLLHVSLLTLCRGHRQIQKYIGCREIMPVQPGTKFTDIVNN